MDIGCGAGEGVNTPGPVWVRIGRRGKLQCRCLKGVRAQVLPILQHDLEAAGIADALIGGGRMVLTNALSIGARRLLIDARITSAVRPSVSRSSNGLNSKKMAPSLEAFVSVVPSS
jgi:hypothetical protein